MRPKYNTYGFGNSFVYIADIMFPSGMIANIDPKEFSYIGLFKGFTSKGERNVGAEFLLFGFINDIVCFLYIN